MTKNHHPITVSPEQVAEIARRMQNLIPGFTFNYDEQPLITYVRLLEVLYNNLNQRILVLENSQQEQKGKHVEPETNNPTPLPCPFCNSTNIVFTDLIEPTSKLAMAMTCYNCHARGPTATQELFTITERSFIEAKKLWNSRYQPS